MVLISSLRKNQILSNKCGYSSHDGHINANGGSRGFSKYMKIFVNYSGVNNLL